MVLVCCWLLASSILIMNINNPLNELSISSLNCNSLNMSSDGKNNQYMKIYGIAKLRTDIIFLSDVRLCSRNMVSAGNDVKHMFLHNPYASYDCYFNSSKNKRCVAILIKKNVIFQC
jgi:hypothetical protein